MVNVKQVFAFSWRRFAPAVKQYAPLCPSTSSYIYFKYQTAWWACLTFFFSLSAFKLQCLGVQKK